MDIYGCYNADDRDDETPQKRQLPPVRKVFGVERRTFLNMDGGYQPRYAPEKNVRVFNRLTGGRRRL